MSIRRSLFPLLLSILFAASASATTRTWTGSSSSNWSNLNNWSPAGVPSSSDVLIFPAGGPLAMTNDLAAGTAVGPMTFNDNYTLSGNRLVLDGDLSFATDNSGYANVSVTFNNDFTIGNSIKIASGAHHFNGSIDVNAQTLTIDASKTINSAAVFTTFNGSGAVTISGSGIYITGAGGFSGTITGAANVSGSLPNATMNGRLTGAGTVGNTTSGQFSPGNESPWMTFGYSDAAGVIHTNSLSLTGGARFDLSPGGTSDKVQVSGTVSLAGSVTFDILSGTPAAGQTLTIIDNDGADPVSGTFTGLPEGASIALGNAVFAISYHGGDGNDVVLTTISAQKSWTGTVSGLWSNPSNWSPQAIPAAGEALLFPLGATTLAMTNDLPAGTSVGPMTFNANYTLSGNRLALGGDLSFATDNSGYANVSVTFNNDFTLGNSIKIGSGAHHFNGSIDVNAQTLTIDASKTINSAAVFTTFNGSGAVNISGSGIYITGAGGFTGTITGTANVSGSLPNATWNGRLTGTGTVGNTTSGQFSPGNESPWMTFGYNDDAGVIHTKSLSLTGGARFDLLPIWTSDQVQVNGTVTLAGAVTFDILGGAPTVGQTFTIIDNDGADPVSGTFTGLPEGASIALGNALFTISYHGGDGNDVVLTTNFAQEVWTGAVSGLWSDPSNWSPQAIPSAGEALIFPSSSATLAMTNDLPAGTPVGQLTFNRDYVLSGNRLTLDGDLSFATDNTGYANVSVTFNNDFTLGNSIKIGSAANHFNGSIDVNGHTLTIDESKTINSAAAFTALNGSGAVTINGSGIYIAGAGNFSGSITGTANVSGSLPNATLNGRLTGTGTVGNITSGQFSPGDESPWMTFGFSNDAGIIHTKSLSLTGSARFDLLPSGTSDQVQVNGTVTLAGSAAFDILSGAPTVGQTFTIIDNDGADPVSGTFTGLPEGATFLVGGYPVRINYNSGDGNDVTLTVLTTTVTTLTASSAVSQYGQNVTFSATVASGVGTPSGAVSFFDGTTLIGTSTLINGVASMTTSLPVGGHSVTASYSGGPIFAPSVSSALSHTVNRGDTSTSLNGPASPTFGDTVTLTVAVHAVSPASGTPGGVADLTSDGVPLASLALVDGGATFSSSTIGAGHHTIVASYRGDLDFNPSISTPLVLDVAKSPTTVEAHPNRDAVPSGTHILITVRLSAPRPSLNVTGAVSISEGKTVLVQQMVTTSPVTMDVGSLPVGVHTLNVSYAGTGDFEASSDTVAVRVLAPTVSISGAAVLEGNSGTTTAPVVVQLSGPSTDTINVSYATHQQTAKEGEDFASANGTLTFLPGEVAKEIDLTVYGDTTTEDDETFLVTLSDVSNATIDSAAATVTILNDDIAYRTFFASTYATVAGRALTLDIYVPLNAQGALPLIIWIPSVAGYDPDPTIPPPLRETTRGYVVANVNYRGPSVAHFPAQVEDLQAAIGWLRTNAAQFGIDPDRIAVWGRGTGAHLAALLGAMNGSNGANAAQNNPAISDRVQAVIDWGGASDLRDLQSDSNAASCSTNFDDPASPESQLIGCEIGSCPEAAHAASPLAYVNSGSAPALIVHLANDCTVPAAQSQRLYDALRAVNVAATLQIIGGNPADYWRSPDALSTVERYLDAQFKEVPRRRAARH